MDNSLPAPETILGSPVKDGSQRRIWQAIACFAVKECHHCGAEFRPFRSEKTRQWMKEKQWNRQRLCSISCSKKLENPMSNKDTVARMRRSLMKARHQPLRRGGNGRLLPVPQLALLHALGQGWEAELIEPTGIAPGNGIPRHYKIDIGNREMKIAIEVDGGSHMPESVHQADMRKAAFLAGRGWSVFHITNTRAMSLYSTFTSVDTLLTSLTGFLSTTAI